MQGLGDLGKGEREGVFAALGVSASAQKQFNRTHPFPEDPGEEQRPVKKRKEVGNSESEDQVSTDIRCLPHMLLGMQSAGPLIGDGASKTSER